jgi:photosystem II stability/assembly factor-like uncharacterized protein
MSEKMSKIIFQILGATWLGTVVAGNHAIAQNWVSNNVPNLGWSSLANSASGNVIILATGNYGPIYTSTNFGGSWTSNTLPNCAWGSVACSADGTKLVAVGQSSYQVGAAFVSTNSGVSWAQTGMPFAAEYEIVASSADGTKMVLVGWNNPIYTSTNSGTTWTAIPGTSDQYTTVASSADGTTLLAAGWNTSGIYVSTNAGAAWTLHSVPFNSWTASACSADGSEMVVSGADLPLFISVNSGNTWQEVTNAPLTGWAGFALTANGSIIASYATNGISDELIFYSTNAGMTWSTNAAPFSATLLASSADGNRLIAVPDFEPVYTSYSPPSPILNITSGNGLNLTWLVPSTNFVLQQNFDLTTTNWMSLTNSPTLIFSNLENQVILSPTATSSYYRLAKP